MHPKLRDELKEQYLTINMRLPKGVRLRLTQTLRTFKEQSDLYEQGRSKPGNIVTNAKPGSSFHNYGLAFDIVILLDKDNNGTFESVSWSLDKHWMRVVDYFKSQGWTWGGDFKSFKDNPHFEKTFGYGWRDLINKEKDGEYPII